VTGHQARNPARVGGNLPREACVPGEGGQAAGGFGCGAPSHLLVLMLVDHGQELFPAGDGLLGFHFGAEAAGAGSGVALEHLDGVVAVLEGRVAFVGWLCDRIHSFPWRFLDR